MANSSLVSLCYSDISHNLQTTPHCWGMQENQEAYTERINLLSSLKENPNSSFVSFVSNLSPLEIHLAHGLAYTTGSALGSIPPTLDTCLTAFLVPNKVGLTAGARAWSKHAHRSQSHPQGQPSSSTSPGQEEEFEDTRTASKPNPPPGWWGSPTGPVATINEKALVLFHKITSNATWRNLHWLPHEVLVYEVRVVEGYGMRWSQDQSQTSSQLDGGELLGVDGDGSGERRMDRPWMFRGFVEPMMENGHDVGWRH